MSTPILVFGVKPAELKTRKLQIERVYHHYEKWEDYKAGLFRAVGCDDSANEEMIGLAAQLLCNVAELYEAMSAISVLWVCSSEVNLTNPSLNRRAWLGQAACCYQYRVPEDLTKQAWHRLSKEQQDAANGVADAVIREWEDRYFGLERVS